MQTFLKILCPILLMVTGYELYQNYQLKKQLDAKETLKGPSLVDVCRSFNYDYSNFPFEGIINFETAKSLADNYNRDKRGIVTFKNGAMVPGEDSKSVSFSLDRLKCFIWNIEKQNCEKKCADSLGLRIYFGRYPNLTDQNGLPEGLTNVPTKYSNYHTLFMVPTYYDKNAQQFIDFYPAGTACRLPLSSSPTHSNGGEPNVFVHDKIPYIMLFDVTGAPDQDSQNHGGLIPPGSAAGTSF